MKRSHVVLLAVVVATLPIGYAGAAIVNSPTPPEPPGVLAVGEEAGVRGTESIERVTRDPINSATRRGRKGGEPAANGPSRCSRPATGGRAPRRAASKATWSGPSATAGRDRVGDKAGGAIKAYPIEDGATCADLNVTTAVLQITDSKAGDSPGTVVHGVAGPKVQGLTLTVKGVARDLALSPRRAFLAVLGPEVSITDVKVVATLKNGTQEVLADPPPMG